MSREKLALEVWRESETPGKPGLKTTLTLKSAAVYESLADAGANGITCRDWHGYDLRHFIRVLRNRGIGIDREWEKHEGGRHGRWRLRTGHSHRVIPYPKKAKPAKANGGSLNPKNTRLVQEGLDET